MMNPALEGRADPAGYRMIESLTVENFRCFENLRLEKLRRINVVVGRNSSGKTALLEALRMGAGATPAVAAWINQVRGIWPPLLMGPMNKEQFEGLWNDFFFGIDLVRHIRVILKDSDQTDRTVEIFFDPTQATAQIPEGLNGQRFTELAAVPRVLPPTTIVPIVFRRSSPTINDDLKATVLPGGNFHMEPGSELGPVTAAMGAMVGYHPIDATSWLSQLIVQNREAEILELVKREYPEIGITSLAVLGNSIWASVPCLPQKIPLKLLSSGVNKFVTLILAGHFYQRGLLLVDEIETGTYFDRLPSLWTALHRVCKDNNNQVFATTHSYECLEAALEVIRADEQEFSLIRVRRHNGESTARQFIGRDVISAIEEGVEIR